MDRPSGHDRHWHYFGGGFLLVGAALLGIGASDVYSSTPPRPSLWTTWYAALAYAFFAITIFCGVGAVWGATPFFSWAPRSLRAMRRAASSAAHWSPIVVSWRGFPSARRSMWVVVDDGSENGDGGSAPSQGFRVTQASYGTARTSVDVTNIVTSLIADGRLDFVVDNHLMGGDPEYGVPKVLLIAYELDGWGTTAEFEENERVQLPPGG